MKRNLFVTDEPAAGKLRNDCVQLVIALALVTRRLELLNEKQQYYIQENINLLILEIYKYISLFEERFSEQQNNESHYSCPARSGGEGQNRKVVRTSLQVLDSVSN